LQPYLFVDVKNNYSTTLQLPEYYELKKQMSELGFSMSFIYSFFIKSHFFAIIKAPFTSVHRLLSLTTNSLMAISTPKPDIEGPIPPINTSGETMDMADFNTYLDTLSKRVYKADVGLLIDGEEFFSHFILNANKATHSIFIRLYIFGADPYAVRLADVLKEKSNEGVQVRLILDDLNTLLNFKKEPDLTYPKDFVMPNIKSYLKEDSKVKVRTRPNTWGTFDHSKVIIIDRDLAYTGGMNFAEEYRYTWHDMMVSLRGPVVGRLVKDFYESWSFVGWGGDYASLYRQIFSKRQREQNIEKPGMVDVRLLYTTPGTAQIFHAHLEAIKRAKKRIYIENAYFGDDRILEGILEARARGVDVRVIFPSKNDVSVMHKNNIIMANKLFKNGVKVYFYRGMTHVKAALYDDWALVGSANFDKMSLFVNKEMSLGISDEKFVNELETRLFEKDFANSDLMEEEFDLGLGYHIVQALAAQF
jgi:cardiolipin synthase